MIMNRGGRPVRPGGTGYGGNRYRGPPGDTL